MPKIVLPNKLAFVLSLIAGALAVLNQLTFDFPASWRTVITYGLLLLTSIGISPLIGSAFRNALHLSAQISLAISIVSFVAAAAVTHVADSTTRGALVGVVTFLAGVGFGPASAVVLAKRERDHPPQT